MSADSPTPSVTASYESIQELFERGPINDGLEIKISKLMTGGWTFELPVLLHFYCASVKCQRSSEHLLLAAKDRNPIDQPVHSGGCATLNYYCRYCGFHHSISYRITPSRDEEALPNQRWLHKTGEWPRAGAPLSRSLLKLAGTGGSLLRKGYQLEIDGFGVGAFAYYRRVVEILKADLFDKILQTAEAVNSSKEIKTAIQKAIRTRSFQNSFERAGDLVPVELLVDGKNPLKILHDMVSVGLHSLSDRECLDHAAVTRETLEHIIHRVELLTQHPVKLRAALGKVEKAAKPDAGSGKASDGDAPKKTD